MKMANYMIVYTIDEGQGATFADDYTEAKNKKMDIECGLGGYAEIYGREDVDPMRPAEYILIEA